MGAPRPGCCGEARWLTLTAVQAPKDNNDNNNNNPSQPSSDRTIAAQGNLIAAGTSGKSPAWFGASHGKHGQSESGPSQGGRANSAAQRGICTQEWGSSGCTATSVPVRVVNWLPQLGPAKASATRTQVPDVSLPRALPTLLAASCALGSGEFSLVKLPGSGAAPRCQANWTLML